MIKLLAYLYDYSVRIFDRIIMYLSRHLFARCGKNVIFFPTKSKFLYKNISIGNNVSIGRGASFIASISHITIGNNSMFDSNVTIRGGNRNIDIIGKLIVNYRNDDKIPSDDIPVVIDDDVLVESGVTILKGVHIGRGAIIKTGTVVVTNVPPYAIIGGCPAKFIKYRWSLQEILQHEELAYSQNDRLPIELLEQRKNFLSVLLAN